MSALEQLSGSASKSLVHRVSRRSFITRLGQGVAVAVATGEMFGRTAAASADPSPPPGQPAPGDVIMPANVPMTPYALAELTTGVIPNEASCACSNQTCIDKGCCNQFSVTCYALTGTNACPSGTCNCGAWTETISKSICPSGTLIRSDCCGNCNGGANCRCVLVNGTYYPTCCNSKCYTGGCYLCSDKPYIECRMSQCLT